MPIDVILINIHSNLSIFVLRIMLLISPHNIFYDSTLIFFEKHEHKYTMSATEASNYASEGISLV